MDERSFIDINCVRLFLKEAFINKEDDERKKEAQIIRRIIRKK